MRLPLHLLLGVGILIPRDGSAQTPVSVPGSERLAVHSTINGVDYQVDVALPADYRSSTERYPVFYILDGNLGFAGLVDSYRMLRADGSIPELILVGVGYPEPDPAVLTKGYSANRSRDYIPPGAATAGGATAPFVRFLRDELLPLIDGRYRTDPADRGLGGMSLGGLFTSYLTLVEPGIFDRYWMGSPSLFWEKQALFGYLEPAMSRATKPHGRAYLTAGGLEPDVMLSPMKRMAGELTRRFPALQVWSDIFPNENHNSVGSAAQSRALRYLYGSLGWPSVTLEEADLASYRGHWKAADGRVISIEAAGNSLKLVMPYGGMSLPLDLFAKSRDTLYAKAVTLTLLAERDHAGRVARLRFAFMGPPVVLERAP